MGLLDSFEKGLERAVNSAFAKTFRSGIQPVEIASALRREADTKAAIVSRDRILTPNDYVVRLSPDDTQRMQALGRALNEELLALLSSHASTQGYSFAGPLAIAIEWWFELQRRKCMRSVPSGRTSESEIAKSRCSMYHCAVVFSSGVLNTTCDSFTGIGSRSRILRDRRSS